MAYFRCGGGLPTQAKAVTATTSQQIVTPDDGNVLESVTVNPQNHTDYYPSASTYYNVSGSESINLGANHNYRYVRIKANSPTVVARTTVWENPSPSEDQNSTILQNVRFTRPSNTSGCSAYVVFTMREYKATSNYQYYMYPWSTFARNTGSPYSVIYICGNSYSSTIYLVRKWTGYNTQIYMPTTPGDEGRIGGVIDACHEYGSSNVHNGYTIITKIEVIWTKDSLI